MASVDFHSAYRDSTRGSTLKALQLRQKELQDLMAQTMAPRKIEHPMQAFGQMAQTLSAGIREGRAQREEAAGRQRFAELLAGGLTDQEMGEALAIDPETALKYQEHTWDTQKEERAAAARAGELRQGHDWDVEAATARVKAEQEAAAARAAVEAKAAETRAGVEAAADEKKNIFTAQQDQVKIEADKAAAEEAAREADKKTLLDASLKPEEAQLKMALDRGTIDQKAYDSGMANLAAKAAKAGMTPGQDQLERDFAKEYGEWTSTGRPQSIANLQQLKKASEVLNQDYNFTGFGSPSGFVTGHLPDAANQLIAKVTGSENPATVRDSVRSVAQESLKAVLGTQFAQLEGQQVLERAFDPTQSPEENRRRIGLLHAKLEQIANEREAKAQYWKEHNMITGYTGPTLDEAKADFMTLIDQFDKSTGGSGTQPATGGGGAAAPALSDEDLLNKYRPKK